MSARWGRPGEAPCLLEQAGAPVHCLLVVFIVVSAMLLSGVLL